MKNSAEDLELSNSRINSLEENNKKLEIGKDNLELELNKTEINIQNIEESKDNEIKSLMTENEKKKNILAEVI